MEQHPLRTFRLNKGMSLETLAELSGSSKASLSRVETGLQQPNFETIRKLIDISDGVLTADDFINFLQPGQPNSSEAVA